VIREPFQVTQRKVPVALLWEGQQAEVVECCDQQLCLIGAEALGQVQVVESATERSFGLQGRASGFGTEKRL
jgi:hypothetical protein